MDPTLHLVGRAWLLPQETGDVEPSGETPGTNVCVKRASLNGHNFTENGLLFKIWYLSIPSERALSKFSENHYYQ